MHAIISDIKSYSSKKVVNLVDFDTKGLFSALKKIINEKGKKK